MQALLFPEHVLPSHFWDLHLVFPAHRSTDGPTKRLMGINPEKFGTKPRRIWYLS